MGSVTQEYSKTSRMKAVICLVLLAVCISLSTASSYTYTLATSYELLGKYDCKNNNIKYVKDTTLEKCQLLCDGLTDCKAVMMVPGKKYCYLKKSGCLQHKISNHICQLYEKTVTTYTGYKSLGKYDCKNNNIKYVSHTTLAKCQELCDGNTDCKAVMMVPGKKYCYLKKSGSLQHKISNHICQLYEKEETTYSYTAPTYSMLGKYDCKNNNLKYLSGTTLEKCQEKCNSLTDCAAVMMVPSKKYCYLKKSGCLQHKISNHICKLYQKGF